MAARRYAGEGQEEAPEKVTDLTAHHCLGYTLAPLVGVREWAFGLHGAVRVPINALHRQQWRSIGACGLCRTGIVYAPRFMTGRWIAEGRLTEIAVDVPLLELGAIYALTHASRRPAARTRA
jgi:DNA-binding transcriptional LysR family regulator